MSVRKRKWTTRSGEEREAWVVDYVDQQGDRHIETFDKKKDADVRHAQVGVDVRAGVHVAPSKSVTVKHAGRVGLRPLRPLVSSAAPSRNIANTSISTSCLS